MGSFAMWKNETKNDSPVQWESEIWARQYYTVFFFFFFFRYNLCMGDEWIIIANINIDGTKFYSKIRIYWMNDSKYF